MALAALAQDNGFNMMTWNMASEALSRCETIRCPPSRSYPFMYLMMRSAQSLNLPYVAAEIMHRATVLAAQTGDATTYAYALETLGTLSGRTRDFTSSAAAFRAAFDVAQRGNQAVLTPVYLADWQTDQAEILSLQGNHQAALDLLRRAGPVLLASDFFLGKLRYLTQMASTQDSLGHADAAVPLALKAVDFAERSLPSLKTSTDRERWQQANRRTYGVLVRAYLDQGDITRALQAWERFRSAAFIGQALLAGTEATSSTSRSDSVVLVLAHVGDRYIGWAANPISLHASRYVDLGADSSVNQMVTVFYRLCSDPNSTLSDVTALGSRLYSLLIEPFSADLGMGTHLWIELDQSLQILPFSALCLPSGSWLGTISQITIMPSWWSLRHQQPLAEIPVSPEIHLLAVSGFDDSQTRNSEFDEIAKLFHRPTLLQSSRADRNAILEDLSSAEIFHFSGHASSIGGQQFLSATSAELTPDDIRSLHLSRCRIAILAACNTAGSEPDQLEKLPDLHDAFLLAGAGSVVASSWDVDDRSTHALMTAFYEQLVLSSSPTQSLQRAQQTVRSIPNWQHPYYWASFEVFHN